jgi:hypothetical protein
MSFWVESAKKGAVLLSIDLEHVGVGIVQLSVIAVDPRTMNILEIGTQALNWQKSCGSSLEWPWLEHIYFD